MVSSESTQSQGEPTSSYHLYRRRSCQRRHADRVNAVTPTVLVLGIALLVPVGWGDGR